MLHEHSSTQPAIPVRSTVSVESVVAKAQRNYPGLDLTTALEFMGMEMVEAIEKQDPVNETDVEYYYAIYAAFRYVKQNSILDTVEHVL